MEEETGYRVRSIEHVLTFQPMAGSADSAHELYLARGADRVGTPLTDEAEEVRRARNDLGGQRGQLGQVGLPRHRR